MKTFTRFIFTVLILSVIILNTSFLNNSFSQSPQWMTLPNAPVADSGVARYDDTYFINPNTGWIIQGTRYFVQNDTGKVFKTTDGGNSWILTNHEIRQYLRSVGFFNENTGIIGTLHDSLHILYRTTDGGFNWTDITNSIQGTIPSGICGISIVNSTTAIATGRYYCPANIIRTTNAGLNWTSLPIDTSIIRSIVDCHFWSADSGYIVGGYSSTNLFYNGKSVVAMTTNGGLNWTRVYISPRVNEWCWKIQFVNRLLGYVSIERDFNLTYYLKTTDGGLSWSEKPFMVYDVEGIGFLNENTGWIGGWGFNNFDPIGPTYETTNAGASWHLAGWGINMNRVRFLSDTLAYAVGKTVYKFSKQTTGINQISSETPKGFSLSQNYPNPFNPSTNLEFGISDLGFVTMKVFDIQGKEVSTLVNEKLNPGTYKIEFDGNGLPSGVYFYKLEIDGFADTKRMILLK